MTSIPPLTTHKFYSTDVLVAVQNNQSWYILYNILRALNGSEPPIPVKADIHAALGPQHTTTIPIKHPDAKHGGVRKATGISLAAVRWFAAQGESINAQEFLEWLDAGHKFPPAPATSQPIPPPKPITYDYRGRVDLDAVRESINPVRTSDSMFRFLNSHLTHSIAKLLLADTGVEPIVHMDDGTIYVSQPIADIYTCRLNGYKFKIRGNAKFSQVFECPPGSKEYTPVSPAIRADIPLQQLHKTVTV